MARPEDRLQVRCAMFAKSHVVEPVFWTAVEHGRKHTGSAQQRAAEWQRLARKGVKSGLADMWFFTVGYAVMIELKAGANKPTEGQNAFQAKMAALGFGYEVVRSVEQLGEKLVQHGIPVAPGWRLAAQHHDAELETAAPIKKRSGKPRAAAPTRTQAKALQRLAVRGVFTG